MWLHNVNVAVRNWHFLVLATPVGVSAGADYQMCACVSPNPSPTPPPQEGGGYVVGSLKSREAKHALQNGLPVYT